LKGKGNGVCRVNTEYALGFDLKMGSPSFVIVAIRDWKRTTNSTLDQMMGRSSRDQGTPKGVLIILDADKSINVQKIKAASKARSANGADNLACYYNNY